MKRGSRKGAKVAGKFRTATQLLMKLFSNFSLRSYLLCELCPFARKNLDNPVMK